MVDAVLGPQFVCRGDKRVQAPRQQHEVHALGRQPARDRPSNAFAAAGDEGGPSFQSEFEGHAISFGAIRLDRG